MEYMDYGSLHDLLKNDTMAINGEIILPILRDISQGVRFLHSADPQVVHGGKYFLPLPAGIVR
jgi:serine/threonine protein kinase